MTSNVPIAPGKLMPAAARRNSWELVLEVLELRYWRLFQTAQGGIVIFNAKELRSSQAKEASPCGAAA